MPLAEREPAILHMGTVDYKNPRATLAAFAALQTPARLVLTGKVDDALRATITRLPPRVRERIELPGFLDAAELRDLLGPSAGGLGAVRLCRPCRVAIGDRAVCVRTPVVAGDSISRDVLEDGVNGAVVRGAEPLAMARRIDELLTDDALWTRLSVAALERSRAFGAEAVAGRYLELATARGTGQPLGAHPAPWPAQRLAQQRPRELRVGDRVALGQPTWLAEQPEQPLQPGPLHPARGARGRAGREVERGAHREQDRCPELAPGGR